MHTFKGKKEKGRKEGRSKEGSREDSRKGGRKRGKKEKDHQILNCSLEIIKAHFPGQEKCS